MLINIFNTITNLSPNVEGMTAISSWMIACMMFVFFALLGYAGLLYYSLVSIIIIALAKNAGCLQNGSCMLLLTWTYLVSCLFCKRGKKRK